MKIFLDSRLDRWPSDTHLSSMALVAKKLHPLEYRVFRNLKNLKRAPRRAVLACSGGMDSVVLLRLMAQIAKPLGLELHVVTVHHGDGTDSRQNQYRAQAVEQVREFAKDLQLPFHLLRVSGKRDGSSEADMREFRYSLLSDLARELAADHLFVAHHSGDLLETRLIRMIRGTGPQGLMAMSEVSVRLDVSVPIVRPFLQIPRLELERYAIEKGLSWCEDPSNMNLGPLRNWLRREWLAQLEKKRPGSVAALSRSVEQIADQIANQPVGRAARVKTKEAFSGRRFSRSRFLNSSRASRREKVAETLLRLRVDGFSSRHVDEIIKRIESRQVLARSRKGVQFELLNLVWNVNARQVAVIRKDSGGLDEGLGPGVIPSI